MNKLIAVDFSSPVQNGGADAAKKRISDVMYAAKYIAFFSVCCAHTYYHAFAGAPLVLRLLSQFGTFGVAVFFFISGYYFKKEKPAVFIRKKTVYLLIPWAFWGCAAYATRFFDNSRFTFNPLEILRWLLGDGTYLWFLTVLVCIQILFSLLPDKKSLLAILMAVTVASRAATASGLWALPFGARYNVYLNLLNWVGFFALGRYAARTNSILPWILKHKGVLLPACLAVCVICGLLDPVPAYGGWTNPVIQLSMIPVALIAADFLRRCKVFILFGQYTLCLYLIHMPFIGKANTIFQGSCFYALLKPAAVTLLLSFLIFAGLKVSQKIKLDKPYCLLTGLRRKKAC